MTSSCSHVYTFGIERGQSCSHPATKDYCAYHSIEFEGRNTPLVRDVCSFLLDLLVDREDFSSELFNAVYFECSDDIQDCIENEWDTASKDVLYSSMKDALTKRGIVIT